MSIALYMDIGVSSVQKIADSSLAGLAYSNGILLQSKPSAISELTQLVGMHIILRRNTMQVVPSTKLGLHWNTIQVVLHWNALVCAMYGSPVPSCSD